MLTRNHIKRIRELKPLFGFDNFNRTVNTHTYFFRDSKLVCITHKKLCNFIPPVITSDTNELNLITMDIETRTIDNKMIPYCICFYDGTNSYSFYLSDYGSVNEMFSLHPPPPVWFMNAGEREGRNVLKT